MKARTKFLVTIFVILSLGLALSLSLLFHYSIQNTKRQAIICNNNFASAIHEAVYVLMKTGQQDSLYEYLDAVRRSGSVNEVRVIRSSVLDREIGVKNTPLQQDDIARQVLSSGQKIVEKTIVESKKAIRTVMPIVAEKSCLTCHSKFKEGQTVAALSTTFIYQSSIDQMIQSLIQNFLMQGLIILLVAGLIFIFFIRLFIHPLERLRKGMDIVAGGDMDHKIGILGHDEISELSESFDLMTAKLKASTTSIEILNKEVSERKLIENKLMDSEFKFRSVIDQAGDAFVLIDEHGRITDVNNITCRQLGFTKHELLHLNVWDIVPQLDKEQYPLIFQTWEGKPPVVFEIACRRKSGVFFPAEVNVATMQIKHAVFALFFMRDFTERKKIEQELIRSKNAAESASKAKSEFLANMSHELRTPLNAILGFSDILRSTDLEDTQKEYLDTVISSGGILLAVINDILDFTKLETEKIQLEKVNFDLEDLVNDSFKIAKVQFKDHKINSYVDWDSSLPSWVNGDPTRLRQVLLNLLNNAVKFTHKGEIGLTVGWEKTSTDWVLVRFCVKDTGIGIPKDKMEELFQSFTQADSSHTRKYGGMGLGLAIAKRLVNAMGGRIWFESQEGKGSQFFFTVELGVGSTSTQHQPQPVSNDKLIGKSVLCVDDHQSSLEILSRYCQELGLEVIAAASGQEALQKLDVGMLEGKLPDLIISDIMMPQIDGYLLAERIRANHALDRTKIIAITSDVRLGTRALAKEKGFNAFLPKPIYRDQLSKIIYSVFFNQPSTISTITVSEVTGEVNLTGVRVLVVDDTRSNQQLMKVFLDMWGCLSDFAGNGQEAIDRIKTTHYDICLMDLQMPVLDGFQASKFIRDHINKKMPIIALTAAVMQEDIDRSYEAGMNDFLPKPVDVNNLRSVLIKYAK